ALHGLDAGATEVEVTFARGDDRGSDARRTATLRLPAGWKRTTARDYAWRPFKWGLSPAPGFGGPALDRAQKERLGIDPGAFAFRVQYLVTWGANAHRGRAAAAAGIRNDDVVVSFDGRDDFDSVAHGHAWVRLTKRAGETVEVVVLRGGKRRTIPFRLPK
ncbi:MAG: PDZ domain-containing protein, partial [Planctomycetes bacterium]|nr:PDZ domain-containing protein [Planctomycetota bacterium]